jgi:hypothetical protein
MRKRRARPDFREHRGRDDDGADDGEHKGVRSTRINDKVCTQFKGFRF